MRNWKNLRPNTSAHGVRSTGSAVRLRLLSRAIIGIFVLSGVSCKSAKTVTQASAAVAVEDSLQASAVNAASVRTAGGTPGTGTARIRIMLEPSLSPALPQEEGKTLTSQQPLLVIEAEADGNGGTAPDVEAASSGENHWESSGRTAANGEADMIMKPPDGQTEMYIMGLMGLMGLLGIIGYILKVLK